MLEWVRPVLRTGLMRASPARRDIRRRANGFLSDRPAGALLDVGGGSNTWLADGRFSVISLELDASNVTDVKGSVEALPIRSDSIPVVALLDVLEHLPTPEKGLEEIARVLSNDGALILSVPFLLGRHDYQDFHRWTEQGLRALLKTNGFHVAEFVARGRLPSTLVSLSINAVYESFGRERAGWRIGNGTVRGRMFAATLLSLPLVALHNLVWFVEKRFPGGGSSSASGFLVLATLSR